MEKRDDRFTGTFSGDLGARVRHASREVTILDCGETFRRNRPCVKALVSVRDTERARAGGSCAGERGSS